MIFMAREALAELKGKFSELWSQTWAIMAATAAMSVVVLVLGALASPTQVGSPLIRLVLFSTAGAMTYCAVLFAIGSPVINESIEVAGWVIGRHRAEK